MLTVKLDRLQSLFREMQSVLVAFSGGVDSSVVYKVAHDTLGAGALAVTAASPTLPEVELEVARAVSAEIGGRLLIMNTDQLVIPDFTRNDAARCYHCKTDLYQALEKIRAEEGAKAIADGTNLDDLGDERPGMTAAREWGVRSPLVEAALTKADVRDLARALGLSNWGKPAAACLSSRVPRGIVITRTTLSRIEQAEAVLFEEGLRQVRVRDQGELARIEVAPEEILQVVQPARRERITARLKEIGYRFVTLDLEGYQRGSAN